MALLEPALERARHPLAIGLGLLPELAIGLEHLRQAVLGQASPLLVGLGHGHLVRRRHLGLRFGRRRVFRLEPPRVLGGVVLGQGPSCWAPVNAGRL